MKQITSLFFVGLLLLFGSNPLLAQEKAATDKVQAYMVADAHLDTQWNWDIQTTIKEYVWNTLSQNLLLLKRYPNYVFNFEGGVKYAFMKEYYPLQYEQMIPYIKNGRWHLSGASWDATDALVPSIESAIRNILLGQDFYRTEFGVESTDIFLPDCFGFGWTLPTYAKHCGLIGFSSQKLGWRTHPFYGKEKIPFTLGLWKGVDGSQIMFAHSYDYTSRWDEADLSRSQRLLELAGRTPLNKVNHYYGTGDVGGSPTLNSVLTVENGLKGNGPVQVFSATSDQLFQSYLPYEKHPELPMHDGELLMDVHGTGCYTSQAAMKCYNRQNELLGDAAERSAVMADWLGLASYPTERLRNDWRRFIFHQFHDDLTGTSIPRAYEFSWNDELLSLKDFADVLIYSSGRIAHELDTRVKGAPVVLYNALGREVTDLVEVEVPMEKSPRGIQVFDDKGREVPSQWLEAKGGKVRLLMEATVPAVGYAVYEVRPGKAVKVDSEQKPASTLENSVYRIKLNSEGDIVSLYDKRANRECVQEGKVIRLALFNGNESYDWPSWEILKRTVDKTPVSITGSVVSSIVEKGALRQVLCVEKTDGKSTFKQYIRLYEGARAERIDFYNEVDWNTPNALLKAEFPLQVANPKATYDLGIGSVQRGNNTETAYEVYAQQWANLTDRDGGYGMTVMNDCKYGWDKPDNHTLRLTLLHTPGTTEGNCPYQGVQDFGHHCFTYSLVGQVGSLDKPQTVRKAELLNQPLKAFAVHKKAGTLGKSFSFVTVDNTNLSIRALKKAERSDEYVLRLYETKGEDTQEALLTFASDIVEAVEADGTEKTIRKINFTGNSLKVKMSPYSLLTLKVKLAPSKGEKKTSAYQELPLDWNRKCTSLNGFFKEANFESGYSYAAELMPEKLVVNEVPFKLGRPEFPNGMTCRGDTLRWNSSEGYQRLYFLAASTDGDVEGVFQCGKQKVPFEIPYYTGFVGQWGHKGHTEGFLKEAKIAFVGTHRHALSGDQPYEFTYLFEYAIDLPKGTTEWILPKDERIVIFAATLAREDYQPLVPAAPLFRTNNRSTDAKLSSPMKNLLKAEMITGASGYIVEAEKPEFLVDGNIDTKWCDNRRAPNWVEFDMGTIHKLSAWKVVNAGREETIYITGSCFLQGKKQQNDSWQTLDSFDGNTSNVVSRTLFKPQEVRYLRLLVTRPTQVPNGNTTRIYELEVYE